MKPRRTVVSLIAAAALSASIAGPTLAAAPTFAGSITCTHDGESGEDMGYFTQITKKEIASYRKLWINSWGFCERGSVDTSALVKN